MPVSVGLVFSVRFDRRAVGSLGERARGREEKAGSDVVWTAGEGKTLGRSRENRMGGECTRGRWSDR
jgi:hypothetical protein